MVGFKTQAIFHNNINNKTEMFKISKNCKSVKQAACNTINSVTVQVTGRYTPPPKPLKH